MIIDISVSSSSREIKEKTVKVTENTLMKKGMSLNVAVMNAIILCAVCLKTQDVLSVRI